MASRYQVHPIEQQFQALEQQHQLARLAPVLEQSMRERAKRNEVARNDPARWRAAEIELRRSGDFERAVYCQQMADALESESR